MKKKKEEEEGEPYTRARRYRCVPYTFNTLLASGFSSQQRPMRFSHLLLDNIDIFLLWHVLQRLEKWPRIFFLFDQVRSAPDGRSSTSDHWTLAFRLNIAKTIFYLFPSANRPDDVR